jgi:hypothetical protein
MERAAAPKAQECYGRSSKKEASRHAAPDARERVPTCAAPPDASIVSPVTNPFRSELRNAAIAAISLAAPARPTGVSSAEMRESTSASERELTRGGRGGHRGSCCSPNCPWRPPRSRLHSPGCHPSRLPVRPSQDGRLIAAEAREQERSQDRHWERVECASAD